MSEKSLEELCQEGQDLLKQGQTAPAIALFQKVVDENVDHIGGHEGLALAYSMLSDWGPAEKHYAKLIQLQPIQARHYLNLGTLYHRQGDYQKAVDTLRRALQRDRKNANTYFSLGLAYRKLKQTAMSVSAYREAIKLSPEFAEAYLNLANVYLDMGSLQQAMQMFKQALEVRPNLDKAIRGLEKVQHSIAEAKKMESPFGRLVDADRRAKTVPTMERELTAEERGEDRKQIRILMEALESLVKDAHAHLENVLEQKMHALQVTITSNAVVTDLTRNAQEFKEAIQYWTNIRQQIRRKMMELRAHEELMSAPEVKL